MLFDIKADKVSKDSFSVIGKVITPSKDRDFRIEVWNKTNQNINEILPLAKKDSMGNIVGIWGLMQDSNGEFKPFDDDSKQGYYLAGIEVNDDANAPSDWVKWTVPKFDYYVFKADKKGSFIKAINHLRKEKMVLVAPYQEFYDPKEDQQRYLYFAVKPNKK